MTERIEDAESVRAGLGNGTPSGSHYNLNIIGVPKDKSANMNGNNGHRIFVKLEGKSNILLSEGEDVNVLDANGTDGTASFELPNPDPDSTGITEYSVFGRALGKPGGCATLSTCAIDTATARNIAAFIPRSRSERRVITNLLTSRETCFISMQTLAIWNVIPSLMMLWKAIIWTMTTRA